MYLCFNFNFNSNKCLEKDNNHKGQSVVEYIMLLMVVISLAIIVLRHPKFKEMLGANGTFYAGMRKNIEHGYKHGYSYNSKETDVDGNVSDIDNGEHWSYYSKVKQESRFFQTLSYPVD
ncbi:MAG: hypothetical protein HQK49_02060 [Oligoflexia bacterium]|nr:hypothetical protein [Oligoflexia bacterium]